MHGPNSPETSDFIDGNQPSLPLFLKRAAQEELDYDVVHVNDFTIHGFEVERLTLAPKLLVLYRSNATVDILMDGALRAKEYALDVDCVQLNPTSIANIACDSYYRTLGPTSKLTMMLALTSELPLSAKRRVILEVHEVVHSVPTQHSQ
jgi:hypothetical protein